MGKYANIDSSILSVFGTDTWKAEKIKTYPSNFIQIGGQNEFIRISIIPSGQSVNLNSVSGIVLIEIFTKAGEGPKRSSTIADKLDVYLSGKSFTVETGKVVQFMSSNLSSGEKDPDNATLFRVTYSIPFNYFEVL